jgi:hypothetical protein
MGILSTLGRIFGGLIFTVSLGLLVVVIALAQFTNYNNLQPLLSNVIAQQLTKTVPPSDLDNLAFNLRQQCGGNAEQVNVDAGEQIGNVSLNCSDVSQAQSSQLPNLLAKATFDKLYYKQYPCDFLQCIQQLQGNDRYTVIITAVANKFFNSAIIPLATATVLGLIIAAAALRTWYEIFKSIGVSCLLIGIVYFTFPFIQTSIQQIAPGEQASIAQQVISNMFDSMKMNLLMIFILGVILTVVGFSAAYFFKRKTKRNEPQKETEEK